jgi:integrase
MTRGIHRLSTRSVATLKKAGRYSDGGGLYLSISQDRRRWVFRFTKNSRVREMGLGAVVGVTLAEARKKAAEARREVVSGNDPIDRKKAASKATAVRRTFGQCTAELIASKRSEWRSAIHAGQWTNTLNDYCAPILDKPVDEISTAEVLSVLQPIWARIPETASRVRGRIEAVLDYAKAHGLRSGENPASWRGHLALILPRRQKLSRGHHAAMDYADVPTFIADLRKCESIAARALEVLVLTAARSAEVLGARWSEIDLEAKVWTIPAHRMKAGREHRVPLSSRALTILEDMARLRTSGEFIFSGQRYGKPLSSATLETTLRKMKDGGATIHGFRSSFRDWAGNETNFPREVCEVALAHSAGDSTEQAYRRSDSLEKRRALMESWASYCGPQSDNIIPIMARR